MKPCAQINAPQKGHFSEASSSKPPLGTVSPRDFASRTNSPNMARHVLSYNSSSSFLESSQQNVGSQLGRDLVHGTTYRLTVNGLLQNGHQIRHLGPRRTVIEESAKYWLSSQKDFSKKPDPIQTVHLIGQPPHPRQVSCSRLRLENKPVVLADIKLPPPVAAPWRPQSILLQTIRSPQRSLQKQPAVIRRPVALYKEQEQRPSDNVPRVSNILDVIDPEISALSTLTNIQNSLFVPDIGGMIYRLPAYALVRATHSDEEQGLMVGEGIFSASIAFKKRQLQDHQEQVSSIAPTLTAPFHAVLPDGYDMEMWTREEFVELNDHVRHMLHSRRSKFKRGIRGFWIYTQRPLGFLVTLYATLITLFGLIWVLFLIGWINVGGKQLYTINVIDNILVALFAIMGIGLAPFRTVDTYHMIFIAHYTLLTWKIRRKRHLPALKDKNDLPAYRKEDVDCRFQETGEDDRELSVLNHNQQLRLRNHQNKFMKSHTFYKPHTTLTHHAFPLRVLIAIVILLDCHSLLQIALGACTWSMETPGQRPFALTTVILFCSIACNLCGGLLITIGDRQTRKNDIREWLFRQQLTEEVLKKMENRKLKNTVQKLKPERQDLK